jgi:hypothetical protein
MRAIAVAVLLLILSPVLRAADGLDQAEQKFRQMDYAGALKLTGKLLKSAGLGPEELVRVYRVRGLSLAATNKSKEAAKAFALLLAIDPSFRLSDDVSPKLLPPFELALKVIANKKPIGLSHQPPDPGQAPAVELAVTLDADPFKMVKSVRLRCWPPSGPERVVAQAVKGPGTFKLKLPAGTEAGPIRYAFEALNRSGSVLARAGSEQQPFSLGAPPAPPPAVPPVVAAAPPPPNLVPPPGGNQGQPELVANPDPPEERRSTPWYKTWWFWTGVGVLVAGAVTGGVLGAGVGGSTSGPIHYQINIR